jgi:CheY-like chemotaxis protein
MKKDFDILAIDDEPVVIDAITKICSLEGYSVDSSLDAKDGLEKCGKNNYKLIICDIMMPGVDGFAFLNELRKRRITIPVIMTTGYTTVENAVKSLYAGAIDFIPKPFTADELSNSVLRGMRFLRIQNSLKSYKKNSSEIIYVLCPPKYYRLGNSSWADEKNDGSAVIGATDLFLKTIDNIAEIELMHIDDEVVQGNPCANIHDTEDRIHPMLSPLSGRIIEVNEKLKTSKNIIEKDPYFQGWFYRIIPSDTEYELKNLINCSSDRI